MLPRKALLTFTVICCTGLVPLNADDLAFHDGVIDARTLDTYLAGRHYKGKQSPLSGSGNEFMENGRTFDVDPRLIAAISGIETSFALRTCATNNAWNWFWEGPCPKSPFDSYASGIKTLSKYLKRNYINKGYNTIALIQTKYCAAPVVNGVVCPGWISTVTLFRNQMTGIAPTPQGTTDTATDTPPLSEGPQTSQASQTSMLPWAAGLAGLLVAFALGWRLAKGRRPA